MILKVVAAENQHAGFPGSIYTLCDGQSSEYIGREFDAESGTYPISKQVVEFELKSKAGKRVKRLVQRGEVLAFDEMTASTCGVPFNPLTFKNGTWVPKG